MNDDIKEINIKRPGQILDYVDTKEHLLALYNYITNLQRENQELKEYSNQLESNYDLMLKNNDNNLLMDYKSRCEKAVEYLKNNCYIGNCINTYEAIDITNVMNILNGRSDE